MIKDYYHNSFRSDLAAFFRGSRMPYFGHAWSSNCGSQINKVTADNRPAFLVCLYFTVLVDQAMHAHFRQHYRKFADLTKYPKFCHGLGQFHHNPRGIFSVPVDQGIVASEDVKELLPAGMSLFVDEVIEFFNKHMPQIDPSDFFSELIFDPDVQIIGILELLNPELADDVVHVAYKALRDAAERAGPQ